MFNTDSDNIKNVSKEFVAGINNIFADKVKRVILYGSYARGDFDNESDIDVMTLIDMPNEEIRKKLDEIIDLKCEIDDKYNVYLSPMELDINHFTEWLPFLPYYKNIDDEGVVWYG